MDEGRSRREARPHAGHRQDEKIVVAAVELRDQGFSAAGHEARFDDHVLAASQLSEVAQLVADRRHARDRRLRVVVERAELVTLGFAEQGDDFAHHVGTWCVAHRDHGDARYAPCPHLLSPHTCSHVLLPACLIHRHA